MQRRLHRASAATERPTGSDGVSAGGFGPATVARGGGETRRALITCALAMYPLVGSATIILAAVLLAGGAQAG